MRRFSFPHIPAPQETFFAPEDQVKHISSVLRMKTGDIFEATDGTGFIYSLCILSIDQDTIQLQVLSQNQGKEKALLSTAFLAELKNDAMDDAIAILAEHGIPHIIPFFAERSIPKLDPKQKIKKQERRQKIANESLKKVGGIYSCTVRESLSFKELAPLLLASEQKIIFWEREEAPSHNLNKINYQKEHSFIIGPEGGFTQKEITQFLSWDCEAYSLGTRILRAPQACSAAASIIRYLSENQSP